ncbi:MAG: hypothetical protein DRO12_02220 [Thermoprotei archaeon]|nr:MAG: hypothetical protein DRO12_02220 [Thermoprotei archaeon]
MSLLTFKELYSIIKSSGTVAIVYSGNVGSAISAAIMQRVFTRESITVLTSPFYKADIAELDRIPIITIGLRIKGSAKTTRITPLEDVLGVRKGSEIGLNLVMHSISSPLVKVLEDLWVITRELKVLALIGALLKLNSESLYNTGLEEEELSLIKTLASEGVLEIIETLRLFGYPHRDLLSSLTATLDPYIPGIFGNEDEAKKFLSKVGIAPEEVLDEEKKVKLVKLLNEHLLKYYRREAPNVLGEKIVLRTAVFHDDIYEYSYSLLALCDLYGIEYITAITLSQQFSEVVTTYLRSCSNDIREFVEGVLRGDVSMRRYSARSRRYTVFRVPKLLPLSVVSRVVRFMGYAEGVVVFEIEGEGFAVSVEELDNFWPTEVYSTSKTLGGVLVFKSMEEVVKYTRSS